MKTFKRKFNAKPSYSKCNKLWKTFIEQELQSNNLKNLMQLTERAKEALTCFEIKKFSYSKKSYYLTFTDGNNAALSVRKVDNGEIEILLDYYSVTGFTSDEEDIMTEIIRRAPIHRLTYLRKHYEKMLVRNRF